MSLKQKIQEALKMADIKYHPELVNELLAIFRQEIRSKKQNNKGVFMAYIEIE